ncbi:MAG TPA: FG-GAP-like repeat-containing protein [Gaiellaceae bacterium]|nr:FG-GAP-like repeat-containing protein [Gaiellaceae bacterium]
MTAVAIRGTSYPVVFPKLRDPRLHLAATITSLQVLGQVAFNFRLSISQILVSLGTCAVIEIAITFRTKRVIMWPASALLTGNGVAFVLRIPDMTHGDWWSFRDWWLFAAVAGGSLLSKHVIKWKGEHVFNPSNIGLVACFVIAGRGRADPLDFWWGPMSWWMALALAIIVTGGFTILRRLHLLRVALGFWAAFAVGIGVIALAGHQMTARWHLGPITGWNLWWILISSPEVLVFLFFMITDPKTAPAGGRARVVYAVTLGLLAALLIAPTRTEFAAKVALLGALTIVCAARPLLAYVPRRVIVLAAAAAACAYVPALLVAGNGAGAPAAAKPLSPGALPPITILPSKGVQTKLTQPTADLIAHDLLKVVPAHEGDRITVHLEPGAGQSPPFAVAQLAGRTYRLNQVGNAWALQAAPTAKPSTVLAGRELAGTKLTNVASTVGLDFTQGSFRFGVANESKAMMGGGVCFIDYNGDGKIDLFAVNSYASADTQTWDAHGGLPRSRLFENVGGRFSDVTSKTHAGLAVQGDGCVAADLNGDGRTDLAVTTTSGVELLWNEGGTFRTTTLPGNGWYTGIASADVNGDGRPDLFVAGYSDPNDPVPGSFAGFPTNIAGVRDLLFLNDGGGRFREVGIAAGLEASAFRHGLGAQFMDVNGDGRPDLYVANDEDPNELYVNVPWPGGAETDPAGLGFRFEERATQAGIADPFAGMGVAAGNGRLLVTNSRGEPSAAYLRSGPEEFSNDRPRVDPGLGRGFAGWGASWVDLQNTGRLDLVLTAGAIPVTNLAQDAEAVRVLAQNQRGALRDNTKAVLGNLQLNGRGLAVADVWNDGRQEIAINTIGGNLVLLQPTKPSGHWLDVALSRFSPGAVVTAILPSGRSITGEVRAGSSYLSSEDPRVHFGLGSATRVAQLIVRSTSGQYTRLANVPVDRVVTALAPPATLPAARTANVAAIAACSPAAGGRSVARTWNDTAVAVLRAGDVSEPVQARDLYDLALAVRQAYSRTQTPGDRDAAISFAAYRLLLWQAAHGSNLSQTFGLLSKQLRALCYSPSYIAQAGPGAALGNRIAAEAIAAGGHDGSNESLHYADPTYTPQNQPLIVAQAGSTVHDATFWQPLALAQVSPRGSGAVPAAVQSFVGSQWGGVRTFAGKVAVPAPTVGDPDGAAYGRAAIAAIRATAGSSHSANVDTSPAGWNAALDDLPRSDLRSDVEVDLALNAALNDAAVAAYGAKRTYQTPRPISMIRYLAFNGRLPIVAGLTRRAGKTIEVRLGGRWVRGDRWAPPAPTPASPGYPSTSAAFAAAAEAVAGKAFAARAAAAENAGVEQGTELPADAAVGKRLGTAVAKRVLARLR